MSPWHVHLVSVSATLGVGTVCFMLLVLLVRLVLSLGLSILLASYHLLPLPKLC